MAPASSPLAIYGVQDQARASVVLQSWGNPASVPVSSASLGQPIQSIAVLRSQIDSSNPIVMLVSSSSATSTLFQSIALYCESNGKRLIIVDLDDAGTANVTGNIKNFSDSVICSSDAELENILEGSDRWTLPSGGAYPETGIKHQKKC